MIIVDFDYTLFNTHLFYNAFTEVFYKHGIPEDVWKRTYDQTLRWDGGDYGFDYSFEKQVDVLIREGYKLDPTVIVPALYGTLNTHFLYNDAPDFLQMIQQHFEERVLMTAGNPDYQRAKVEGVKVNTYFTDIIYINGDKEKYLYNAFDVTNNIIFINDNLKENVAVKRLMPQVHVITKFNPRWSTLEEAKESDIPYFETLTAIKDYVTQELI